MEVKVLMIVIVILILICGLLLIWAIIAHFAFLEMKDLKDYWIDRYGNITKRKKNIEKLLKNLEE